MEDERTLPVHPHLAVRLAVGLVLLTSTSIPAGENLVEPGQWKVTSTTVINGAVQPAQAKARCISAEQAADVAKTFGPVSGTINSTCEPIQRSFDGKQLTWHLICKGQLDMELNGMFDFDSPHHYAGTVHSTASMAGQLMTDSKSTVEGEWVSACPQ